MNRHIFQPGDWVIFRVTKFSIKPGQRAEQIMPARQGDGYSYTVDKFWVVQQVNPDGSLVLRTRRGKRRTIAQDDLRLRKANWWERWRYRARFEAIEQAKAQNDSPPSSQQKRQPVLP